MRLAFFIALLSLPFFAYECPPHQNVSAHNDGIASSLLGSSCLNRSDPTYDNPIICAEIELLTIYPSVDYRISAERESRILWRYAYAASSEDKSVTDEDGCTSYYHKTFQSAEAFTNLSALFRNETYFLENISDNPVALPVQPEILNQTQGDSLALALEGRIIFHYILDRTVSHEVCVNESCSCVEIVYPSEPFNITRYTGSNLTYEVEGGSLLHFLTKPILGEQWARNSQFEDLVFSKRKFYLASLSLGNASFANTMFYKFEINTTNDSFDVWRIVSLPVSNSTNMSRKEMKERTTPVPIEIQNDTFVYIYVFNSSYPALGQHTIALNMSDHFCNNFSATFNITNRLLTIEGTLAENGETDITNSSLYRPSAKFVEKTSSLLLANLYLIGALFLVFVLVRR